MELPRDIMVEILCNLSIKTLLQFQTVNKTWRNNINYLLLRPKLLKRSCFICVTSAFHLQFRKEEPYSIVYEDDDGVFNVTNPSWQVPLVKDNSYWDLSYTHGLFCLSSPSFKIARKRSSSGSTWIFNPSTQQYYKLPSFTKSSSQIDKAGLFTGFGFDSSISKVKVVQIFQEWGQSETEALIHTVRGDDIFSYSWKKLDNVPQVKLKRGAVAINGSLHWLTSTHGILSFELASERFGFTDIPDQLRSRESESTFDHRSLYDIGGFVCVCVCHRSHKDCVELWILKQESWTQIVIKKQWVSHVEPIMVSKKKEIIFLWDQWYLVSYNMKTRKCSLLREREFLLHWYRVYPYFRNMIV